MALASKAPMMPRSIEELQAENRKLRRELFWQIVLTALTFCLLVVGALLLMTIN